VPKVIRQRVCITATPTFAVIWIYSAHHPYGGECTHLPWVTGKWTNNMQCIYRRYVTMG